MEELNLELMKVDQAEKARKVRRDMLRRLKVSPGVWTRFEVGKARGPLYINGGNFHSTVYLALCRNRCAARKKLVFSCKHDDQQHGKTFVLRRTFSVVRCSVLSCVGRGSLMMGGCFSSLNLPVMLPPCPA